VNVNTENLRTLANYLANVPDDKFSMHDFVSASNEAEAHYLATGLMPCNAVACAAGYGPAAGIAWDQPDPFGWVEYIDANFLKVHTKDYHHTPEYLWCFFDDWKYYDNTASGAAKRIHYMLHHGIPDGFEKPARDFVRIYDDQD
jgi:hypothetical protein